MGRPLLAAGIVAGLWAVLSAMLLAAGELRVLEHVGDGLHMIAIVERMAQGQLPHLDFMTPIGALAFWPIAMLVRAGLSVGMAFLVAQSAVAAVLAALTLVIATRRMAWPWVAVLGALVIVLCVAVIHGGSNVSISVSMHYNRWAWAMSFGVLIIAALPPSEERPWDGVVLGLLLAGLVMIKVTYFAVLAPLAVLGLVASGQIRTLTLALSTGALTALALTGLFGVGYWMAYLGDLLTVTGSTVRAQPGDNYTEVLFDPAYLAANAIAAGMGVALRRSGMESAGLFVILLVFGGAYITYQNFGNDPQWLALLAVLLAVWAADMSSDRGRQVVLTGAVALAAIVAPSYHNMLVSPYRHLVQTPESYIPLLVGTDYHQDVRASRIQANRIRGDAPLSQGIRPFDPPEAKEPVVFQGEVLPDCIATPQAGYYASVVADLKERGLAQGATLFVMDVLNPYWLYGAHPPLAGGAPWYYGGLAGYEDADFVLSLTCPTFTPVRDVIAAELSEVELTEVARTPLYTLYTK